ncbi:MAG TPA: ECF-type sigma factor [Isosphaeraceae bacterium]|jgi:DNA-directed RNA polymerase specialized sigma24 family protein
MPSVGSITQCLLDIEVAERRDAAVQQLWDRVIAAVAHHALRRLQAMRVSRGMADEEDVAERAFTKVCRGIEVGRLKLQGRVDFRKLLLATATREAINQYHRQCREIGREVDDAILPQVPDPALTPAVRWLTDEACRQLLDLLGDDELRQIALWKLVGHTNPEIARRLDCSLAKVERKLDRIRSKWAGIVPHVTTQPGRRYASSAEVAEDIGGLTTILRALAGRSVPRPEAP